MAVSTSRTQQRNVHTNVLPHSSKFFPSLSTGPSAGSKRDPMGEEKHQSDLIPLYVFVTLASMLCVLVFGGLAMLYLKRKIKSNINIQTRTASEYLSYDIFIPTHACLWFLLSAAIARALSIKT